MLYAIVCKNPFIYLYNEKEDILKSDFEFVVEEREACGLPAGFVPEEYNPLTPSIFSKILDDEVKDGYVYTFSDGSLVRREYARAPYFYIKPGDAYIEYPTYCPNANTIKAALLTNEELLPVVSELVQEEFQDCSINVSPTAPVLTDGDDSILAYVCIPIVMKRIPIGRETEEERQEELEDQEDF